MTTSSLRGEIARLDALRRVAFQGLLSLAAGVAAVAASYAAVGYTPAFVVAPVGKTVTVTMPGAVVTFAITVLGDLGAKLALGTAILATVALHGVAATTGAALVRRAGTPRLAGPFAALATAVLAVPLTGSPTSGVAAGLGAGLVVGVATLAPGRGTDFTGRREVLAGGATAIGVGVAGVVFGGKGRSASTQTPRKGAEPNGSSAGIAAYDDEQTAMLDAASERSLDVDGIEPLVSEAFYEVDISQINPDPDREEWSLSVTGAVEEAVEHGFADVTDRPTEHRFVSLRCVGEDLNGRKLDTALWSGVAVSDLIADANPQGEYVMVRAADGFFEEFPADALEDALLAYEMNGEPLPRGHGYPARLLVPGHWGEINVKWVTEIEFLEDEKKGYWEKRGWHGTGPVNTVAKLWTTNHLADGRIEVAGHAYAGTRGIARVEVSTDGGETWNEAELSDPLPGRVVEGESTLDRAQDAWRQWRYRYDPPEGSHEVVVRAIDRLGNRQPRKRSDAFPSGPTGWVSKTIEA